MAIRLLALRPSGALETLMIYTLGDPARDRGLASLYMIRFEIKIAEIN